MEGVGAGEVGGVSEDCFVGGGGDGLFVMHHG